MSTHETIRNRHQAANDKAEVVVAMATEYQISRRRIRQIIAGTYPPPSTLRAVQYQAALVSLDMLIVEMPEATNWTKDRVANYVGVSAAFVQKWLDARRGNCERNHCR